MKGPHGGLISVLNLMEVVTEKTNPSSTGVGAFDYFNTLYRQSFPGPLVGGNVGNKELNKWIDERIANCESPDPDYRKGEVLRLLLTLLKLACQHYGKLRSPLGTENAMRVNYFLCSNLASGFFTRISCKWITGYHQLLIHIFTLRN